MSLNRESFVSEYLQRIGYTGSTQPCLDTLLELQRCHLFSVPFENLDMLQDDFEPNLDLEYLFDKIVRQRRGGVCHELNTLFYHLLTALGFDAVQICGSCFRDQPLFGHTFNLVHLPEGDYTADVGFGDDAVPPLNLTTRESVHAYHAKAWVEDAENGTLDLFLQRPGQEPAFQYRFCTIPRGMEDFMAPFRQISVKGFLFFTTEHFCCRFNPKGKALLLHGELTVIEENNIIEKRAIAPGEETVRCLREYFDLP